MSHSFDHPSYEAHAVSQARQAHALSNSPEQQARDAAVQLAGRNRAVIVEIESPNGDRINVQPCDLPTWKERGWHVVLTPVPD